MHVNLFNVNQKYFYFKKKLRYHDIWRFNAISLIVFSKFIE